MIGIVGFLIDGFMKGWERNSPETQRQSESQDYELLKSGGFSVVKVQIYLDKRAALL